jgi:hypothetical protein
MEKMNGELGHSRFIVHNQHWFENLLGGATKWLKVPLKRG